MIDTSKPNESPLVRMGALHANNIEECHKALELSLRANDEAGAFANLYRIQKNSAKLMQVVTSLYFE